MRLSTAVSIFLASLISLTNAFPSGAGICNADPEIIQNAEAMGAQNPDLTFTLANPGGTSSYNGQEPVIVTLNGEGTFSGLLLYAATTWDAEGHVGTWSGFDADLYKVLDGEDDPSTRVADCSSYGSGATLSHASAVAKPLPMNFTWVPPAQAAGDITYFAAVVVNEKTGFKTLQTAQALTAAF